MDDHQYEKLIAEYCACVGISTPQDLVAGRHVELGDVVVGLIPDLSRPQDGRLSVYFDLGPVYPARDPGIHRALLLANVEPGGDCAGAFGLHPFTGHAVYHMQFEMPMSGSELAQRLEAGLDAAQARFAAIKGECDAAARGEPA